MNYKIIYSSPFHNDLDVAIDCPMCGARTVLQCVPDAGFSFWIEGAFIKDALPELKNWEQEVLISGLCRGCQDSLFTGTDF